MPRLIRSAVPFPWMFAIGLASVACGDDDAGGPSTPAAATIAAGDDQEASRGAPLPDPLAVVVTDARGQPYQGAEVTWSVVGGGGSITPTSGTSNAQGRAEAAWTLGTTTGLQSARAHIAELDETLTFTATAVDPCATPASLALGTPVSGTLEPWDCAAGGTLGDRYRFQAQGGDGSVVLLLSSTAFPPALAVVDEAEARQVAVGNGVPAGTDARIRLLLDPILAGVDDYLAVVAASNATMGDYTLTITVVDPDVLGCETVWVTEGTMPDQALTNADCVNNGFYSDQFLVFLTPGQDITIDHLSSQLDAYLTLLDPDDNVVATDDDGGVGTNARIAYTAAAEGAYVIDAGTFGAGETGTYTLIVSVD